MFLETISIENGKALNLKAHVERMERTALHFGFIAPSLYIHLSELTSPMNLLPGELREETGKIKCRVLYRETIQDITFERYRPKAIQSLKMVEASPDYAFKYADRSALNDLVAKKDGCDDILIVRNGLITDTSYSNVVLSKGEELYTPAQPLLHGTRRQKLLREGIIREAKITPSTLHEYDRLYLINAMVGLEDNISLPTSHVKR